LEILNIVREKGSHPEMEILGCDKRRARELAEESSRGLSNVATNIERQWEVYERERQEHFEELTLL
jgi:hypothetical protein